jgi:ABC-type sugar transport system permease subunit
MRKMHMTKKHREWLIGYLFIGIWVIGFALFTLFPTVQSFIFSLKEVRISIDGLQIVRNLDWENYTKAFTFVYFVEALWNYILNTLITIPSILVFSVLIGTLLNSKIKLKGFFRTIYFLPVVISSGPVLSKIQSEGATVIPSLSDSGWIGLLQGNLPAFMSDSIQELFSKIVMIMWFTGVPVILVIAGLQKIDKSIYEAASIDGASAWESFWKITLPSLKPILNIMVVFSIVAISLFSSSEINEIINARKYTQYGLSNAFSWIYFAVSLLLLMMFLLILNMNLLKNLFKRKRKAVKRYAKPLPR